MALIQLQDLVTGALRYADLENAVGGASSRFSTPELYNYVNRAIAHVYRNILVAQSNPHFIKDQFYNSKSQNVPNLVPPTYPLPQDFLQIMSVCWANQSAGPWGYLERCEEVDRAALLSAGYYGGMWPSSYMISGNTSATGVGSYTQGTIPVAYGLEILPAAPMGSVIWLRYIPTPPQLLSPSATFDGIVGYEEAVMLWAAILMRRKDDLPTEELERDLGLVLAEMRQIAKTRDRSGPPKVTNVRNRAGSRTSRRGRGFPWSF